MSRQERVKAMRLTMEEVEGYDDTKPRSQLAFGRLLGFIIGGDPQAGVKEEMRELIRLFTGGYLPRLFTGSVHR